MNRIGFKRIKLVMMEQICCCLCFTIVCANHVSTAIILILGIFCLERLMFGPDEFHNVTILCHVKHLKLCYKF